MKIGLIDLDDTKKFPNLALMKVSAYYKSKGNEVEWYKPLNTGYDLVSVSKVFTWSKDYPYAINSKKIIYGGVAYGLENKLEDEIEHHYPDYSIYPYIKNTAYGFLTRGCPRQCAFCNVSKQQGTISHKVANLSEFWQGQKEIKLLDPNILAAKDWKELFKQLIESSAQIDFTQGLDIRLMDQEKADYINKMKIKKIHFAWDQFDLSIYEKLKEKVDAYYNEPVFSESNPTIPDVYQRTNTLKDSLFEPVITQNGNTAILTTGFEDDYLSFEYSGNPQWKKNKPATGQDVLEYFNSSSHGGTVKGSHDFWDEAIEELGGEQGIVDLFKRNCKKVGLPIK